MAPKRSGKGRSPSPKRAKRNHVAALVNPKINLLVEYLEDSANSEVPGSHACRDMVSMVAPYALGKNAAAGERHKLQESVISMIGEVVQTSTLKWQKVADAAQMEVDAAESSKTAADAALQKANEAADAQQAVVKETKHQLAMDSKAVKEAEAKLKEAEDGVSHFDEELVSKTEEMNFQAFVINQAFLPLQAGDLKTPGEKSHAISNLSKGIKHLGIDDSLKDAVQGSLFKQDVAERGETDTSAISMIGEALKGSHAELAKVVLNSSSAYVARVKAQEAAKDALEAAKKKKEDCNTNLLQAQSTYATLHEAAKAAKAQIPSKFKEVKHAQANLDVQKSSLEKAKAVSEAFEFLREPKKSLGLSVTEWQTKVDQAKAALDACNEAKANADTTASQAANEVQVDDSIVAEAKVQLESDSKVMQEAEEKLSQAKQQLASFDGEQRSAEEAMNHQASVIKECFLPLKAGELHTSKARKEVAKILKTLPIDQSLKDAIHSDIFAKDLAERGDFDNMTITKIEEALNASQKELETRVSQGDSIKAAREAAQEAAQKEVEAAREKKAKSADALTAVKEKHKSLEAALKDAKKHVAETVKDIKNAQENCKAAQTGLEGAKEVLACFEPSPPEEPEA